jgi:predicted nucleotidyltransferase
MKLNIDLSEIIASKAKIAVLKYLLNPGFSATGRELSRLCGISHTQVIKILKEFEDINLAVYARAGKSDLWRAKTGSYAYIQLNSMLGRKENFSPLEHLKAALKTGLKNKNVLKAVIFGSVAGKNEESSSDIDLFVLVKNAGNRELIQKKLDELNLICLEFYGNSLSPYVLTEKEYNAKSGTELVKNIDGGIEVI